MTDADLITTIEKAMEELKTLIDKLPESSAEKQTLRDQRNKLRAERNRFFERTLDKESAQYAAANKALGEGIALVQAAIDDIQQVAGTIAKIAGVITQIGKVAVL